MIRYLLSKLLLIEAGLNRSPSGLCNLSGTCQVFVSIGATMAILLAFGLLGSFTDLGFYIMLRKESLV